MPERTERDFWIEMSIREISTQSHFAEIAYQNLDPKADKNIDAIFSSIHSFLSHCANVSKLLKGKDTGVTLKTIEYVLDVSCDSIIHDRKFRNNLEHYDDRLKKWVRKFGVNAGFGTYNIGPKSRFKIKTFISHYDPTDKTFTFVNEHIKLSEMHDELINVKQKADNWVKKLELGEITPPYLE